MQLAEAGSDQAKDIFTHTKICLPVELLTILLTGAKRPQLFKSRLQRLTENKSLRAINYTDGEQIA